MIFKTRNVQIEAIQFNGFNIDEIGNFINLKTDWHFNWNENFMTIKTLEGDMKANIGDWIIKGLQGEFYPCKPDIFFHKYEPLTRASERD